MTEHLPPIPSAEGTSAVPDKPEEREYVAMGVMNDAESATQARS